ncbi:hypothetical protein Focb16_v006384 [Fusarium oxysporum f. sp. cubense]|uniref:Uncharacterized protein n=1 Tax=Fusarium oxysporum f. sp. cubense TaxID=61366 RepID=A0A559LNX0_FUSOC|nr:hypothetical protein Focb16_v006384 [Fusarium oxysporum f. sp. cubense]
MPKVAAFALLWLLAPFQLTDSAMIPLQTTDFGVCTDPTIIYVQDQDGMLGYGYKPANADDFPHGATADIATTIDFIRSTLQNACRAPTASWFLCTTAAAAANGKEENVVFGDHIDPIWWFNEYLKADGQPAICGGTPHRMPNDHYITFTCEGEDPNIVPMMKEALIAVAKDTIDNTVLPDDQRMFMHREGLCWDGHNNQCHITEGYPSTVFPQSVHVAVAIEVPGTGGAGALSGNLRYNIADSSSNNCGMCSYLSTSGGAVSAVTSVAQVVMGFSELIVPGIAFANAVVSFSCLTTC